MPGNLKPQHFVKSHIKDQNRAYLFALCAVVFWSTIAVAFKLSLDHLCPFQIVFLSSCFSLFFFIVIRVIKHGLTLNESPKEVARSALLGLLNPFLYYVVLLHAYDMITAQEAMTLNYIWPIVLALLSVPLLGQKFGRYALTAMIISFSGIVIIATKGSIKNIVVSDIAGASLAAGSSIIWALYWILNVKDKRDVVKKMSMNFFFGTIYALIAVTIFSTPKIVSLPALLGGAYLGLFEMGLTFMLWLTALKLSKKTYLVSQFIFLAPFLSLIWIRVIIKEPIMTSTLIGLALVITGIIIQQKHSLKS